MRGCRCACLHVFLNKPPLEDVTVFGDDGVLGHAARDCVHGFDGQDRSPWPPMASGGEAKGTVGKGSRGGKGVPGGGRRRGDNVGIRGC